MARKADTRRERDEQIRELAGGPCLPGTRHYRRKGQATKVAKNMVRTQGGSERLVYPCRCGEGYCVANHGAMKKPVRTSAKKKAHARGLI